MHTYLFALAVIDLAASPGRQIVSSVSRPIESIAVTTDGYVATIDSDSTLRLWQLSTRALLASVSAHAMTNLVHPIDLTWDEETHEVLLAAGDGVRAVSLDGQERTRPGEAERW